MLKTALVQGDVIQAIGDTLEEAIAELASAIDTEMDPIVDADGDLVEGYTSYLMTDALWHQVLEQGGDILFRVTHDGVLAQETPS